MTNKALITGWPVMHVRLVEGRSTDRALRSCMSAFRSILRLFSGASFRDRKAYAELLCRLSRRIRLRLCASPKSGTAMLLSNETTREALDLLQQALDTLIPMSTEADNDTELNEFVHNIKQRRKVLRQLLSSGIDRMDECEDRSQTTSHPKRKG